MQSLEKELINRSFMLFQIIGYDNIKIDKYAIRCGISIDDDYFIAISKNTILFENTHLIYYRTDFSKIVYRIFSNKNRVEYQFNEWVESVEQLLEIPSPNSIISFMDELIIQMV